MPMRIRPWLIFASLLAAQAMLALGQTAPASAQSTVLASGHFDSIPEMGVYFRIYGARLGAGQHATYAGSNALLYELEGSAAIDIDGTPQDLAAERAAFVPAGRVTTIRAAGPEAAVLLVFVLSPVPNQRRPVFDRPAVVRELFRTEEPLQGLHPGPYRFSLSRVSMPPGTPAEPSHHRSGAAVDFILAGVGAVTADGKSEPRQRGEAQFEPAGSAQRWENPGDVPLVLLQAAVSPEGEPAVVPAPPVR
jgi:mannose-6-phosphate isomerase-like protein (cupin superfamily)